MKSGDLVTVDREVQVVWKSPDPYDTESVGMLARGDTYFVVDFTRGDLGLTHVCFKVVSRHGVGYVIEALPA